MPSLFWFNLLTFCYEQQARGSWLAQKMVNIWAAMAELQFADLLVSVHTVEFLKPQSAETLMVLLTLRFHFWRNNNLRHFFPHSWNSLFGHLCFFLQSRIIQFGNNLLFFFFFWSSCACCLSQGPFRDKRILHLWFPSSFFLTTAARTVHLKKWLLCLLHLQWIFSFMCRVVSNSYLNDKYKLIWTTHRHKTQRK